MRIERIEIDGFGRFHDASWPLAAGLTVVLGANEAGKTTLLNALRALLFGFEATRDGRTWYPPLGGGRRGGRLILQTASGERWTVERHGERGGGGALAVRAPNGNQGGQETLDRLLHGADKDLFSNIFAFGLGELQTFASLSADGVRGRIYGAGTGLGGTSALELERRLRQQLDASFLPRGSQRPLNQLLARIEELRREIADLSRQPEEHAAAHRARAELDRRVDALRLEASATRERLIRLQHLREAGPIAAQLAVLDADLAAGDATLDRLPEDAEAVLDRRQAALAEAEAVLSTMDAELIEARRLRAEIGEDTAVIEAADEIAAVVAAGHRRTARVDRRRDLAAATGRLEGTVTELRSRAGGWDETRLVALDDAIPTIEATREHESRLAQAAAVRLEAEQRRRAAHDAIETAEADALPDATWSDDELDARASAFRELQALPSAAGARGPSVAMLAASVAVVVVATVAGWAIDALVPGLLVGLVLALLLVTVLSSARTGAQTADPRRAGLLAQLRLPPGASAAEIGAAWEDAVAQRARRDLGGEARLRQQTRRAELERRDRDLASAADAHAAAADEWRGWLTAHRMPATISPEAARQLLTVAGQARRAVDDRDHQRGELASIDAEDAADRDRIDRLCAALELTPSADDATRDARVVGLAERLERSRTDRRRAGELDARIAGLEARRVPAAESVDQRRVALEAHLAALGCPDPDAVRRRVAAAAARRAMLLEVREHRARLVGIAGGPDQVDAVLVDARVAEPAALEAREVETRAELDRVEAEAREATSRIGALDAEIRRLEAAEELGACRQELVVLEGRAATLAREWAVRALALRILEETRARYERERQPDVVRAAERHFERITGGRYARIVAPPGESNVRVETQGGEHRVTDELSRGTGEQLYLAIRFGLIEEFARHGEPLPVIMDDILVNFDAERASRAAAAIGDLASRHQVLYFTCHPPTAELLDPGGERTLTLD